MFVITGGSGFIGSALLWGLNRIGIDKVMIVDLLKENREKFKNIEHLKFFDVIDAWDFLNDFRKFNEIKIIFHFGAITDTTFNDENIMMKNNYEYSVSLTKLCREKSINLFYASSAATYGTEDYFEDSEESLEKLKPANLYARSKHLFDLWVKENKLFEYLTSLKFFNVYGPNEYHKGRMASFIYQGYNQAKNNGVIRLFKSLKEGVKDGEQKRDFIYIKDVVDILIFIYEKNLKGIYNVGTGIARSFNDIVKSLSVSMGKEIGIEYIDMPDSLRGSYQYYTCADIRKLRISGYSKEFYSLEDGINDYVKNYLEKTLYLGQKNKEKKEEI